MDIANIVKNTLSGFVSAGADKAAIIQAFQDWNAGSVGYRVPPASHQPTEESVINLAGLFYRLFPGLEPSDNPEKFFTDALNAANGNPETVAAVFDIQRQNQERGQWRDETFPAGLVFWMLKNKEHDKLRKQGYAIRKQREAEVPAEEPTPPTMPKPAPVETAAFTPSSNGIDRVKAALSGLDKKPV
jgi:hypothetical protein